MSPFSVALLVSTSMVFSGQKPEQLPKVPQSPEVRDSWSAMTYKDGMEECRRTGTPLVVFVGCPARFIPGVVISSVRQLDGIPERSILLAVNQQGKVMQLKVLGYQDVKDDLEILRLLGKDTFSRRESRRFSTGVMVEPVLFRPVTPLRRIVNC